MSRKIRFAIASLIISSLTAGSLNAFPLGHPTMPADREAGALTLFVGWVVLPFLLEPAAAAKPPRSPHSKIASQIGSQRRPPL